MLFKRYQTKHVNPDGTTIWIPRSTYVGDNVTISPLAELADDVIIGSGASIGASEIGRNVVICVEASVGNYCTIEEDVIISAHATIGNRVAVRCQARIGYQATLGHRSEIGIGARIGDRVRIGQFVTVVRHVALQNDTVVDEYRIAVNAIEQVVAYDHPV